MHYFYAVKIELHLWYHSMTDFIAAVFNCSSAWKAVHMGTPVDAGMKLPEINILRSTRGVYIGGTRASDYLTVDKKMTTISHNGIAATITPICRVHLRWFFGYTGGLELDPTIKWDIDGLLAALIRQLRGLGVAIGLGRVDNSIGVQLAALDAIIARAEKMRQQLRTFQGVQDSTDTIATALMDFLRGYTGV